MSLRDVALRVGKRAQSKLLRGAITQGPPKSQVALTFDDGPDPRFTGAVLDALKAEGAGATFFMLGPHVEAEPALVERMAAEGHDAALHMYTHERAVADDDQRFRDELKQSVEVLRGATGAAPRYLRMPFGYLGKQSPKAIRRDFGLETVHWSFSSMDSRYDAEAIVGRVDKLLFPGAIVLLHDGVGPNSQYSHDRSNTVAALPGVIAACRAAGLEPVSLTELLGG